MAKHRSGNDDVLAAGDFDVPAFVAQGRALRTGLGRVHEQGGRRGGLARAGPRPLCLARAPALDGRRSQGVRAPEPVGFEPQPDVPRGQGDATRLVPRISPSDPERFVERTRTLIDRPSPGGQATGVTSELSQARPTVRLTPRSHRPAPYDGPRSAGTSGGLRGGGLGIAKLETLAPGAVVSGLAATGLATVVGAKWYGSDAIELTYKLADGSVRAEILVPRPRAQPRDRRGGPALELRRRRRALPPRRRGEAHRPRLPLRPVPRRHHRVGRGAAAPDHRGLRADAPAPAAALPARGRPRRRQDDHDRAAHPRAPRPRRAQALPDHRARVPGGPVADGARREVPPPLRHPHRRPDQLRRAATRSTRATC